jgi:hypothetical protein
MIPDDRLRTLLRKHQESPAKPDPGFLESLYATLDHERGRSGSRRPGLSRLPSLAPMAGAAALVLAVGLTGYLLFGGQISRSLAPIGKELSSPAQTADSSGAPSSSATASLIAPRSHLCALVWAIPPQHADVFQYIRGTGFLPDRPLTWTFDSSSGAHRSGLLNADLNGSFQLETTTITGSLGSARSGEYRVSDGLCAAAIPYP